MSKPTFYDVFGIYFKNIYPSVRYSIVDKCNLDIEERELNITLAAEAYIIDEELRETRETLKEALKLNKCVIEQTGSLYTLTEDACADIVNKIKVKSAAFNGYFNGAEYELNGDTLNIELKYGGYETIKSAGFEKLFSTEVKKHFDQAGRSP